MMFAKLGEGNKRNCGSGTDVWNVSVVLVVPLLLDGWVNSVDEFQGARQPL